MMGMYGVPDGRADMSSCGLGNVCCALAQNSRNFQPCAWLGKITAHNAHCGPRQKPWDPIGMSLTYEMTPYVTCEPMLSGLP